MVREPRPGQVKTRLGRDMGMVRAAWWYRHQSRQIIRTLARDPRWRTILAVTPDREGMVSRVWPAGIDRIPQGAGDLGQRMGRILARPRKAPLAIIGSDIPGITCGHVVRAFAALGNHDAVFGPAEDGGYWLVGLKGPFRIGMFDNVRWSSEHALADTLRNMQHMRLAMVDSLRDVDTVEDL